MSVIRNILPAHCYVGAGRGSMAFHHVKMVRLTDMAAKTTPDRAEFTSDAGVLNGKSQLLLMQVKKGVYSRNYLAGTASALVSPFRGTKPS